MKSKLHHERDRGRKRPAQVLDRTPQDDGRLVDRSTHSPREGPRIALPITYSDLTDQEPSQEEVDLLISRFDRKATFLMLAMLNTLLSFVEMRSERSKQVQGFLFANLCDEELYERAKQRFGREQVDERPLFHRQQLLTFMRNVLLKASDPGALNPNEGNVKEARFAIGQLATMFNNLLQPIEQTDRLEANAGEADRERVHDELFVQLLPTVELSNPPDPARSVVRNREYLRIFAEGAEVFSFSNGQPLASKFQGLADLELDRYVQLLYCIYARYEVESGSIENLINEPQRFNVSREETFSQMDVSPKELHALFKLVASDIDSLTGRVRQETENPGLLPYHGFREFRERPLVYTNEDENIATVLDMGFLKEKMSGGIFHTLAELFKGAPDQQSEEMKGDHNRFIRRYWGEVFEIYVNDRFREVFEWSAKHFHASPTYDSPRRKKGEQAFDGLINYCGAVVAMEYKGKYLKLEAKYGEDRQVLMDDLNQRFGKAAKQLADNIELCFNAEQVHRATFSVKGPNHEPILSLTNDDINNFSSIYPVVIVQEHALRIGFANRWLRGLFQAEIANRSVDLARIRPLALINIEDLEAVLPYLKDISLVAILDEYAKNEDPLISFMQVFNNLIRSRRYIGNRPDKWLDQKVSALHEEIKPMFFEEAQVGE
jgi:hypothetical protein